MAEADAFQTDKTLLEPRQEEPSNPRQTNTRARVITLRHTENKVAEMASSVTE